KNFSGMRILNDNGASFRARLLHRPYQLALSNVLDLFVQRENDVFTRLRLLLHAAEIFAAGVDRDQHPPRFAVQFVFVLALNTAEPLIVSSHVADYLGSKFALGVEAL